MRQAINIAVASLVRMARDRRAMVMLLLMPMIIIGILGAALKNMMGGAQFNPFVVVVVDSDVAVTNGPSTSLDLGKILMDDVLRSKEVARVLKVEQVADLREAKAKVTAGKAVAAVYVPAGFTAAVAAGKAATVQVFTDPGRPTQAGIVSQIVRSFADTVSTGSLAFHILGPVRFQQLSAGGELSLDSTHLPQVKEVPTGVKPVSAMQYYAAAMAAMFLVMTAFTRAKDILEERRQGTLARMLVSPTPPGAIVAGQVLGTVVVLVAQFVLLMLGTHFIYGVYWGNWPAALLLGTALAMAASGIGVAAAAVLHEPSAADASVGIVGNLFAAFSGGMAPIYVFPPALQAVAKAIPNYWAIRGFVDQMSGLGPANLWLPVGILAGIGLITGAAGALGLVAKEG